jgi:hypothetical protein
VHLNDQLMKLAHLHPTVGHGVVLHLAGDDVLAHRGPGDEIVAQERHIT